MAGLFPQDALSRFFHRPGASLAAEEGGSSRDRQTTWKSRCLNEQRASPAFPIGAISGVRSLAAPAAVALGAHEGWLDLEGTWAAFIDTTATRDLLTAFALLELVGDKLPKTPSRKAPGPFAARVIMGAFSGAVLSTAARRSSAAGLWFGALGAAAGTLGGYEARTRSVKALSLPDAVVALLEDAVAIGGGLLTVSRSA